ncbi:hypothetical protein BS78_03G244200 [Paspalum vaginatum]|nr:hypothetical protein BS78_03G244200 [Paspalum vaginatum]
MDDVDAVQSLLDLISAEIAASGAMYADAVAEHAQARLRLKLTLLAAASRRAPRRQEEVVVVVVEADDPEVCASTAVFLQTSVRVEHIQKYQRVLVHAQMFLVAARAVAFAQTRAHLLPGVLLTVAMLRRGAPWCPGQRAS